MKLFHRFRKRATDEYSVGGLYSILSSEGVFKIVKVLVLEPDSIHLRIYKNRYTARPKGIDENALSLGTIHDADGFGIGHSPHTYETFRQWQPRFILQSQVTDGELEGYRYWKEAGGGVWC